MTEWGNRVYGLAAIALGAVGLVWGDFAMPWQPVPPETPGYTILAYAAALILVMAGAAMQVRRTAQASALVLAALYAVFAMLWLRRVYGFPQIFGTWLGLAEQLALVTGGVVVCASLLPDGAGAGLAKGGRLVFGLCLLAFGTAHLIYVTETAAMVPAWLPPEPRFWALATGGAHILAGLAFLSGFAARAAAWLVGAMFVGFGALVWLPQLLADPHAHMPWAGNAINFALIGAAWVLADSIARTRNASLE